MLKLTTVALFLCILQHRVSSSGGLGSSSNFALSSNDFATAINNFSQVSDDGKQPPAPDPSLYTQYTKFVVPILSNVEQAMFMTYIILYSSGLQYPENIKCSANPSSCSDKYWGRGYLQVWGQANYTAAASSSRLQGITDAQIRGLFKPLDQAADNPDIAGQGDGAWLISVWYWVDNVRPPMSSISAFDNEDIVSLLKALNPNLIQNGTPDVYACKYGALYNIMRPLFGLQGNGPTVPGCCPCP